MVRQVVHILPGLLGWAHHFGARQAPARPFAHRHEALEANLVTAGAADYVVAGERHRMRPRTLLWLFPDQEHVLLEPSADFAMWIVVFDPGLVERCRDEAAELAQRDPGAVLVRLLDEEAHRGLVAAAAVIERSEDAPARHGAGMAWWLLSAWDAYRRADELRGAMLHPGVVAAIAAVRRDPSLTLPELAEEAALSPSRLSRLFARQVGMDLTAFRNRVRIDRFLELYGDGHGPTMLDAALRAGFGSYAQFHRVFRARLGCSPGAYQRRARR